MNQSSEVQLLADKAQQALWAAFRTGELRGGQFLSMSQLVEILDCPIAAVREAVKQASSQGLVTTFPKRGVQVMEVNAETIRECLDFRMALDQEGARRRIFDGAFTGLKDLRTQHDAMRDAAQIDSTKTLPPKAIEVDLSLHEFLAEGLENSQLKASYDANRMRIAIIQNARPFLQDRIVSAMEEHLAIIQALESCDVEGAVYAIRHHCEQTLRWWGVA
ncbi:GntR family transcriptional regulator [Aliiroseovarius sp. S1339]|uniref:GntR family transcriptional regulator n=1 Tax=Aliiroseovarius sp. S1339 TaxID=2936990 RepID=UPI0020BF541A|nr:GntR family transcriptional regulator [Aliiroseovarius sp. S1339]MCK8464433.1 GntR family transcriptional regulator [Aliiroseovarius sp. S1339]